MIFLMVLICWKGAEYMRRCLKCVLVFAFAIQNDANMQMKLTQLDDNGNMSQGSEMPYFHYEEEVDTVSEPV